MTHLQHFLLRKKEHFWVFQIKKGEKFCKCSLKNCARKSIDIIQISSSSHHRPPLRLPSPSPWISNYSKYPSNSFVLIFQHCDSIQMSLGDDRTLKTQLPSPFLSPPFFQPMPSIYSWYTFVSLQCFSSERKILKMRRRENTKIKLCNLCFNVSYSFPLFMASLVKVIFLVAKGVNCEEKCPFSSLTLFLFCDIKQFQFHYVRFFVGWGGSFFLEMLCLS